MESFGIVVRWVHFVSASLLVGLFAFLPLVACPAVTAAGPDAVGAFAPLDRRLMRFGAWSLAVTLVSGVLDLWRQVAVAIGQPLAASVVPAAFGAVLGETRYGAVWLVRHGLLVLLGVLLLSKDEGRDRADWLALRWEGLGLTAASLAMIGAAGHAASAQRAPAVAIVIDAVHLLATGLWAGGLIPLALYLRWSVTLPELTAARAAAAATRRFSMMGLVSVGLLAATGAYSVWEQVGSVPGFFGTPYGQWLAVKLALLLAVLVLAAQNRLVLKPRLLRVTAASRGTGTRRIVARLRRHVLAEAALGCAILGVVAVLGLSTPARHGAPTWPFSFRLVWEVAETRPGGQPRVAVGSGLAVLGLAAFVIAVLVPARRARWVAGGGVGAVVLGLGVALPPLAVDAYPTTYRRPAVPYAASSITQGRALYETHCARCHGVSGYGDGPAAAALQPKPADLTARHTDDHTAGDLFWWLSHGIGGSAMPGFGDRLSERERWDLINFIRALASAEQARSLGPVVEPDPTLVAPDFTFTTGVGEARALKEYRGERIVLLVLFSLPDSARRLTQLAANYFKLREMGTEILGIPVRSSRNIYRALGDLPVFFPITVDGAEEAVTTYRLFRRDLSAEGQRPDPPPPRHMELLVDRQGYLRARWIPGDGAGWADPSRLLAEVEQLAKEAPRAPAPEEHVH